ncbi:YbcC family protein [Arhodomonas sp. SL1]|uniref:YbcC family protein n=1 Tax=Arhodomonas sp. SL1 TaxID=3425691 RepID=UPI003F88170F
MSHDDHPIPHPADDADPVLNAAEAAVRAVPPLWPLHGSVAVNPFLGQGDEPLATTAARLERTAGARVTMPREWFQARIRSGAIEDDDLLAALAAAPARHRPRDLAALKAAAAEPAPAPRALPTVAELAADASGTDWPGLITERVGAWAAGYFDLGQALWPAPRPANAFTAWRAHARRDRTPEIAGLAGFTRRVAATPESAEATIVAATEALGLPPEAREGYFHRLLNDLGGWAQYARYRLWQAELRDSTDGTGIALLAVRLVWEQALLARHRDTIAERWAAVCTAHARPVRPGRNHVIDAILQEAAERAAQRRLAGRIPAAVGDDANERPAIQAAFCIDVRSEVFRRALEAADPGIATLGFAGFFGLPLAHRRFASEAIEARCPGLLAPTLPSRAADPEDGTASRRARIAARTARAWGRFKLAAVSSFAFVEATGPVYVARLLRDALRQQRSPLPGHEPPPVPDPALPLEARVDAAETVLRGMSLTGGFAPVVMLAGHGAGVINNPHAGALHCGACGGYPGDANARLLAGLLNDPAVRAGLDGRGFLIPEDTVFVGALHDTATDEVTLYAGDTPSPAHAGALDRLRAALDAAGHATRAERARRLSRAREAADVPARARDWAEIRPEWGLAGCRAFVAAPRHRTAGVDLGGTAFLHSYDWRADRGFQVLEQVMTAPVVVAGWISLQYYGSTVAPALFGAGNKLLHNVTGGIGVVEGNGGALRGGLPWQSVHDGEDPVHEPLRLSVLIQAPVAAMTAVLRRHPELRALFDNRWLHLFALDERGRMAWRYVGDLHWSPEAGAGDDAQTETAGRDGQRAAG